MSSFRIVTYNIHKCRGLDRRVRPARIAEVIAETNADIVALQEVWCREDSEGEENQGRFIAQQLGMRYCLGENRRLHGGAYGNVVLSRLPIRSCYNHDITWRGREPRGALRVDIPVEGDSTLHIFNVHLGTAFLERRHQARRLLGEEVLRSEALDGARIVLGDFNEWTRGLATQMLASELQSVDLRQFLRRGRTYPGILPVMHLDHIYYDAHLELTHFHLHRSRASLIASDHLPLVADFRLR